MTAARAVDWRLTVLAALLCAGPAVRSEGNPYSLGIGQALTYESNALGLSSGQSAPPGASESDTRSTTTLTAGFDQPIGRQRVFGSAQIMANRMVHNKAFDNEGYTLDAGLDWATIGEVSGEIRANADRRLARINDTEVGMLPQRNLASTQQLDARFRLGSVGRLSAEAALGHRELAYSAAAYDSLEFRSDSASLGVAFRPGGATTLGLAYRATRGSYPRFALLPDGSHLGDRFRRHNLDLTAAFRLSGISSVDARLSVGRTRYELASQRDFSGLTGALSWVWQPRSKIKLTTQFSRDPGQDSYFTDRLQNPLSQFSTVETSFMSTSLRVRADYALSAKISLYGVAGYSERSLVRNAPLASSTSGQREKDHATYLQVGGSWQVTRSLRAGCDIGSEKRSQAGRLSPGYEGRYAGCQVQFTLQ